ncbi:hypothetical protein H2204_005286 [Knufia peltigerae]|uniref:Cytochrome P450 n=1 Tax=Knufia peltigerae TaxID=1002370 RepID=A0AA38Y629_9EURO|nr:hypothetical protein H2204_005286 [Knufia peltigerae]
MMHDITLVQVPALYWLDTFPALQHLPKWLYPLPAQFRSLGKSLKRFWWALSCEGAERETPNFSHALIKTAEGNGLSQAEIGEMTATLIGGGLDTTSSTLHTLVLALCLFPEVLKRAHDELDRVVGNTAPSWDDLDGGRLPYCAAVLKEAMRWRSVTALGGFAHAPIQDDIYKGYHFPAGIPIFGNVWAMHANPVDFPHPHDFRPERYLDQRQPYPNKIGHSAFGWGRRSCSGQYFAEQSLSQTVARLLWSFDIRPGLDEHVRKSRKQLNSSVLTNDEKGNPVKLDPWAYTDNENTQPLPFKAQFIARNEEIKAHICREAEEGRERLRIYDGETKVTLDQFM